jgi:hypothetical protein
MRRTAASKKHPITPSTVLHPWRPGCPEVATSRRGAYVLMASEQKTGTERPHDPAAHPKTSDARSLDPVARVLTPPGGFRPSRSGLRRTSIRQSKLLESIQVAACPPASLRFASVRSRRALRNPPATRSTSPNIRAGTMKNPRQTFRPTGGSLNLETLFTCDSAGRLATYHPQVFSRV